MKVCVLHSGDIGSISSIVDALRVSHDVSALVFDQANPPENVDVVLNVCDAKLDGAKVPRSLRLKNVPYAGNDTDTLLLCSDKSISKEFLVRKGIRTTRFQVLETPKDELDAQLCFPIILSPIYKEEKVSHEIATSHLGFRAALSAVMGKASQPIMVEEHIKGTVLRVPVIGNESPKALPIIRKEGDAYVHAPVDSPIKDRVGEAALKAYAALRMHGYGIIDVIIDEGSNVFVVDIEPNCALTSDSALAFSASKAGLGHDKLLQLLLDLAISRAEMVEVPIKGWQ
ncbi:hypothetical protein HY641_03115 [Candidatus Woesearchaeota archaeon]|nr:hypothetical protein [Candidatus Woesearchaeota archaeon]